MNEYKKKLAAAQQGQLNKESDKPQMTNGIPNSVLTEVFAGKKHATSEMMGHRVNLAESINAKMTAAFGMDFSNLQVYRSDAMAGTGMKGISQGNKVVLSSDVDLNTGEGQAVLGHELSHIHAQAQGVGMGHSGLYNNAALEHQADREGMLAARGRPIYQDNMVFSDGMKYGLGMQGVDGLAPMSPGLGATAGAPMQAMKDKTKAKEIAATKAQAQKMQPKSKRDASRMAHAFATKSMSKYSAEKLKEMSDDEIKELGEHQNKLLDAYITNMPIPEDEQYWMDERVNQRLSEDQDLIQEDLDQEEITNYFEFQKEAAQGMRMLHEVSDPALLKNPYAALQKRVEEIREKEDEDPFNVEDY